MMVGSMVKGVWFVSLLNQIHSVLNLDLVS